MTILIGEGDLIMGRIIELPCEIGDNIYEIIVDDLGKEISLDRYIVQDVSILAIKYCDEWKDREELESRIFLRKEIVEQIYEKMKISDKYKDYTFFKDYDDK